MPESPSDYLARLPGPLARDPAGAALYHERQTARLRAMIADAGRWGDMGVEGQWYGHLMMMQRRQVEAASLRAAEAKPLRRIIVTRTHGARPTGGRPRAVEARSARGWRRIDAELEPSMPAWGNGSGVPLRWDD